MRIEEGVLVHVRRGTGTVKSVERLRLSAVKMVKGSVRVISTSSATNLDRWM